MCGIAGSINIDNFERGKVKQSLNHRGPDGSGYYADETIELLHTRLSIQDILHGSQPFVSGRYVIVFNGEIYNHMEIRNKYGLRCKTNADTETLLLLYARYGKKILEELDGMFAFAIWDKEQKSLTLARDRAGKKPLYYYCEGDKFCFASELNALKKIVRLQRDEEKIYQYLRFGFFYRQNTPYMHCYDFPPGTVAQYSLDTHTLRMEKWWDIDKFYMSESVDDFPDSKEKVEHYLRIAIKRRLESSDLEVGSFLSGGIDSALVTAFASEYTGVLKTFTVSFDGAYDEAPLARMVADKYHTDHHELKISFENLSGDIEKIIYNYGEPFFDSSAIPSYYVSKAAREHLTVILNGDGADELFGGYRRYVPFSKYDFFQPNAFREFFSRFLINFLPPAHEKKSYYNFFYRLLSLSSKSGIECYLNATSDIFEGVLHEAFCELREEPFATFREDFDHIDKLSMGGLRKIMMTDFKTILFGDLLVKMDIATMANSLEGRSPFLGKELLEYAPMIKDKYKIHGKTTKFILREIAKEYLPPLFVGQPKRGFEVPLKQWVEDDLKEVIYDYLGANSAYSLQFIKRDFLRSLLEAKVRISSEKRAKILWTLFVLEVWNKHEA